jgi:replicative DNA helicase
LDGEFAADESYRIAGGISWLANLAEVAPGAGRAHGYVAAVREAAQLRGLAQLGRDVVGAIEAGEAESADLITRFRRGIETIEQDGAAADRTMIDAPDAAAAAIVEMRERAAHGRPRGLMTGLRCIDRRLNGLKPGSLIVIGGRPSMGKTSAARAIMHGASVLNPSYLFPYLGLEMGPEEMVERELSALTHEAGEGIPYQTMESGALTPFDLQAIDNAQRRTPPNLIFDDCPALSVGDVRRKVWALGRRGKVGAVVIDYLQLMTRPDVRGRNDAAILGDMTKGLKHIARRAGIAIILLSQLSRDLEKRDDKRPMMSDLRESGAIEQDADAVLFAYREFYYLERQEPPKTQVEKHLDWEIQCEELRRRLDMICAKQRKGPIGADRQRYFAEYDFIEDHHD